MIANIQKDLESTLIHYQSEFQNYDELARTLKENSVRYLEVSRGEDYCALTILAQKITLDEFSMNNLFSKLIRVFDFKILYCNMGYEDFYLYVHPQTYDEYDPYE